MDWRSLENEIGQARTRADSLRTKTNGHSDQIAMAALAELETALEKLSVVQEALRDQTNAMLVAFAQQAETHARSTSPPLDQPRQLETRWDGVVMGTGAEAAGMLGVEPRFLVQKPLVSFVPPLERAEFRSRLSRIADGDVERDQWTQWFAVRGQAARELDVTVHRLDDSYQSGRPVLVWELAHTVPHAANCDEEDQAHPAAIDIAHVNEHFLSVIVHELRTPLNAVTSYLSLLRDPSVDEDTRARALEVIDRNVSLQAQLVSDLAERARLMTGQLRLHTERLDLRVVVSQATESHQRLAEAAGLALDLSLPVEPVWVNGDEARLQQVVGNLLTNAIKFTPVHGRVFVEVERRTPAALLRVEDSGAGISEAFYAKLFEQFEQDPRTVKLSRAGLGLGLWIVRELVHAHDGSVVATSSEAGRGTTITVELPALDN